MTEAKVLAINISPHSGAPMEGRTEVKVVRDKGLQGDRYADGFGAFSRSQRENVPPELAQNRKIIRDVTLISREVIEQANEEHQTDFTFDQTRRNILVEGIEDLTTLIGVVFLVGGVAMLGIEACDPCDRPSQLADKTGFKDAFQGRGGLRARALEDGTIRVRDFIRNKITPDEARLEGDSSF